MNYLKETFFNLEKRQYIIDQVQGAVVNRALTYLHGGLLEITLTVPLRKRELVYKHETQPGVPQ